SGPLVEFISEGVAVLESDLIMISTNNVEADDDINAFKIKYPFAFQATAPPVATEPEAAPIIHVEHQPEHEFAQESAPEQHDAHEVAEPMPAPVSVVQPQRTAPAIHIEPLQ